MKRLLVLLALPALASGQALHWCEEPQHYPTTSDEHMVVNTPARVAGMLVDIPDSGALVHWVQNQPDDIKHVEIVVAIDGEKKDMTLTEFYRRIYDKDYKGKK